MQIKAATFNSPPPVIGLVAGRPGNPSPPGQTLFPGSKAAPPTPGPPAGAVRSGAIENFPGAVSAPSLGPGHSPPCGKSQLPAGNMDALQFFCQFRIRQPLARPSPSRRTRSNSEVCWSLFRAGKLKAEPPGPPCVIGLHRRQALPAHPAAVGQHGPPAFARVAVQKTMLPLAANF